ncbi:MAG: DUF192 domain-containing protein [Bacilli bacterium]
MRLIYDNKYINLYECKTFLSRLRGFMFKKNISNALLFDRCNSIHTFFMKENIDVIMCDKDNNILYYYKNIGKNKVILPKKGIRKVFETPSGYFDIEIGKKMIVNED